MNPYFKGSTLCNLNSTQYTKEDTTTSYNTDQFNGISSSFFDGELIARTDPTFERLHSTKNELIKKDKLLKNLRNHRVPGDKMEHMRISQDKALQRLRELTYKCQSAKSDKMRLEEESKGFCRLAEEQGTEIQQKKDLWRQLQSLEDGKMGQDAAIANAAHKMRKMIRKLQRRRITTVEKMRNVNSLNRLRLKLSTENEALIKRLTGDSGKRIESNEIEYRFKSNDEKNGNQMIREQDSLRREVTNLQREWMDLLDGMQDVPSLMEIMKEIQNNLLNAVQDLEQHRESERQKMTMRTEKMKGLIETLQIEKRENQENQRIDLLRQRDGTKNEIQCIHTDTKVEKLRMENKELREELEEMKSEIAYLWKEKKERRQKDSVIAMIKERENEVPELEDIKRENINLQERIRVIMQQREEGRQKNHDIAWKEWEQQRKEERQKMKVHEKKMKHFIKTLHQQRIDAVKEMGDVDSIKEVLEQMMSAVGGRRKSKMKGMIRGIGDDECALIDFMDDQCREWETKLDQMEHIEDLMTLLVNTQKHNEKCVQNARTQALKAENKELREEVSTWKAIHRESRNSRQSMRSNQKLSGDKSDVQIAEMEITKLSIKIDELETQRDEALIQLELAQDLNASNEISRDQLDIALKNKEKLQEKNVDLRRKLKVTENANKELEEKYKNASHLTREHSKYIKEGMQSMMMGLHSLQDEKMKGESSASLELKVALDLNASNEKTRNQLNTAIKDKEKLKEKYENLRQKLIASENSNKELEQKYKNTSHLTEEHSKYIKRGMHSVMMGLTSLQNEKMKSDDNKNEKTKCDSSASVELELDTKDAITKSDDSRKNGMMKFVKKWRKNKKKKRNFQLEIE